MIYLKRTSPDTNLWGPVTIHFHTMQPPKYIDLDRRAKKSAFGYIVRLHGIKTTFYKSKLGGKRMTFFLPAENRLSLVKGWYYVDLSSNSENLNETIDSNMEFILIRQGVQRIQGFKLQELDNTDHDLSEINIPFEYTANREEW